MTVKVLFFAKTRDVVGAPSADIDVDHPATVGELRQRLIEKWPQLGPLQDALLFAVNNDYADEFRQLSADDEVACFPPVSGG
jgi:molybdopterin converting factor subunit 1